MKYKYDARREAEVQGTRIMMQHQTSAHMDLAARSTAKGQVAVAELSGEELSAKPFPNEETYFYGDGSGATLVMVKQDVEVVNDEETDKQYDQRRREEWQGNTKPDPDA